MQLKYNAYNVFWLDVSSTNKEINKRYKDIEKYLSIQELPEYDNDLLFLNYEDIRSEEYLKDCFEILSNTKTKIKEYFFWFQINDSIDEEAVKLIRNEEYNEALALWLDKYNTNKTSKRFFYAKNYLVLLFLRQEEDEDEVQTEDIESAIEIWKDLFDSKGFWKTFKEYFDSTNENEISNDILESTLVELIKDLSNLYLRMGETIDDYSVFWEFTKAFNISSSQVDHSVLNEIYESVSEAVETLEWLNISEDWVFDDEEKEIIKTTINSIQESLNRSIELGFYDDSKILLYRDRTSNAIRTIVLDLHNNLNEKRKSLNLLKIARDICWTDSLKTQMEEEINKIQWFIDEEDNDYISIDIPWRFWHIKELIFRRWLLQYDNKLIKYENFKSVSFYSVHNSVNWITTWTNYEINLIWITDRITLNFSSWMFNSWNKEKWDTFWRVFAMSKSLIEPIIIEKIRKHIFEDNWEYKIGWITFTNKGYFRKKFFWWEEWVLWNDWTTYWIPKMQQWSVYLYKIVGWKVKNFADLSMSTPNAVILTEMIPHFFNTPYTPYSSK